MKRICLTSLIILVLSGPVIAEAPQKPLIIRGSVNAADGMPVMGASVGVIGEDKYIAGTATDSKGRFGLKIPKPVPDTLFLTISAIGFEGRSVIFAADRDTANFKIILTDKPIEYGAIEVTAKPYIPNRAQNLGSIEVSKAARHSLVTTNPTSAIRQPQTVREGSAQSSKLRVNGTSPVYYLNGIEMGQDPNHYGMFSIVPGSVVEKLGFSPQGTGVEFNSPSIVEFATARPFGKASSFSADLSFVEGTGHAAIGGERYFILATARQSVIDKIADKITRGSDRSPIPPTDFRDIFVSAGLRLFNGMTLLSDQYIVRDYLSYDLGPTTNNPAGVDIMQDTGEKYAGLRLEMVRGKAFLKIGGAVKESRERYLANSLADDSFVGFEVDLGAKSRTMLADFKGELIGENTGLSLGGSVKSIEGRQISLRQTNWNFLPPDAASDAPFIYQRELNLLYGSYNDLSGNSSDNALFVSVWRSLGRFKIESGLRAEGFGNLGNKGMSLTQRHALEYTGGIGRARLSYGTYAQSPEGRILEPYQVLVHAEIDRLRQVETGLTSLCYSLGPWTVGAFRKEISNLPRITPDFDFIDEDGAPETGFISMRPDGRIESYGGDITFETNRVLGSGLDIYVSYGFTHATKITSNVNVPYELGAPHKFAFQADYKISRRLVLGGSLTARSGYRYTPASAVLALSGREKYSDEYYAAVLREENSGLFPTNFNSSVYLDLNLGHAQMYITLCNVSNYKNPIIRTNDGYIYDTGILPSLGLKISF